MLIVNRSSFKTQYFGLHIIRSFFIYGAITCWCVGVGIYKAPLSISSILAQTTTLFVLPMAFFFLKEKVTWQCTLATTFGFIGMLMTIQNGQLLNFESMDFAPLFLISATLLFAASDIFNKVLIQNESTLTMMFYVAAGASILGAYPAFHVWKSMVLSEFLSFVFLGIGANLILYCLLKAFQATKISNLMPYRYLELFFAASFGFLLYGEIPTVSVIVGAVIVIMSTFTIAWYETHRFCRTC